MTKALVIARIGMVVVAVAAVAPLVAAEDSHAAGKAVFEAQKCATCHSLAAAGIEAKTKSEKLKGPDLAGVTERHERAWIEQYVRKQVELDGEAHKKEFKGTDEELAALIDWLGTFPSAAASGSAAWVSPASDLPAIVQADR